MNILKLIKIIVSIFSLLYLTQTFAESVTVASPQQTDNTSKSGSTASQAGGSSTPQAGSSSTPQAGGGSTPQAGSSSAPQTNLPEKKSSSQKSNNTDSSITSFIKKNIATNEIVSASNIVVITENGTVKLIGSANSNKEALTLIKIAETAEGVKDLDVTKLMIKGNQKLPEDSIITAEVMGTLIREKLFDDKDIIKPIDAKTTNGVVVLTGTLTNQSKVDKAVKLTQSIKGVNKVKSEIIVIEEKNKK